MKRTESRQKEVRRRGRTKTTIATIPEIQCEWWSPK
jgi:hypothetical protein